MNPRIAPYTPVIAGSLLGGTLGTGCAGYGSGGLVILVLIVGTFQLVFVSTPPSKSRMLGFSSSLIISFYVVGFKMISDPMGPVTLALLLALIDTPVALAAISDAMRKSKD